jgi:hypothetical protein
MQHYTHRHSLKGNKQLVVRKDMDVNEHERQSNNTLRHSSNLRNS